ncbi:hypothetical protein [Colwellia psychrerythraea]|uniref:Uncharacterized protein n=1 Tax=Colwellia psychrerythraea TaxID=28229 RepID=A0A099KWE9_COLPS|nr:hypothetical protein [Colwellia psychrerythraea]KGJ93978.1 hypothetical protein GAB14E_2533 [Colwellia psychrerythraea]
MNTKAKTKTKINSNFITKTITNAKTKVKSEANMSLALMLVIMVVMILTTLPITANAHVLKETSARITLRDGQVEVRIFTDFKGWQTRLQNNQAWLLGDIKQIMPLGLTTKGTKDFVARLLNEETSLMINNQLFPLTLQTISVPPNSTDHHGYTELVLTAKHAFSLVEQVTILFPKSLGAVHASFVKPKYQLVTAGSTAQVSF